MSLCLVITTTRKVKSIKCKRASSTRLDEPSNHSTNSRAPLVLAVAFPLHFLALIFVSARVLVKVKLGRFGREEVLILISAVITLGVLVTTTVWCKFGFGLHTLDLRPEWWGPFGKISYAASAISSAPFIFTKVSMLFFYLRLAPHPNFRIICYISIVYIILSCSAVILVNIFGCDPISAGWNRDPTLQYTCIFTDGFFYFAGGNNLATDILLIILPIPILLPLQLPMRTKLGLVAMFSTGIFIATVSAIFLHSFYVTMHSPDPTWSGTITWMWAMLECNVGIIVACMPGMMLFVKWMRGTVEHKVIGAPDLLQNEDGTIGNGGRAGQRKQNKHNHAVTEMSTTISNDNDNGSGEYVMHDVGGIAKSTEVLLETGTVSSQQVGVVGQKKEDRSCWPVS